MSSSKSPDRPAASSAAARAAPDPVASHHSPGVSPGTGIIGFISTICRGGTRCATTGTVNAPIDCPTRTMSVRAPIAATVMSAYSGRPSEGSSSRMSTATAS